MSVSRSILRTLGGTLAVVLAGGILASSALGSLSIDLRVRTSPPGDPPVFTNGAAIAPGAPYVLMEVWAVVTNGNGDVRDDGLCKFYSSFLSTNGGLIKGDLLSAFPGGSMWSAGYLVHEGEQHDLDGDGDLDIGSNAVDAVSPPMYQGKASGFIEFFDEPVPALDPFGGITQEYIDDVWKPLHDTNEWHVANVGFFPAAEWNVESDPATGRPGVVEIWSRPRQFAHASWEEDGQLSINFPNPATKDYGVLETGDKVILYVASEAHGPEGGPFEVGPGGPPLLLNGSASTGSINWWGWDFDGDGDYEIEGVGEEQVAVTYADLQAMGVLDGHYPHAKMTVGWSASDPVNTNTAEFDFTLVPEPATIALLLAGCLATGMRRRR